MWGAVWGSCVRGTLWGAMWVSGWDCMGELGGWVGGAEQGSCVGHAHQSPDGLDIHTQLPPVLPAQGGFPTTLSPIQPLPSVPAHSSSQVVHCRVCPPHPLHAPVLVLHLAVYPASPTQGRVGLTDMQVDTQCTDIVQPDQMKSVSQ